MTDHRPPPLTLGKALRAARERRGLSQHQLAQMLGASQQSYARWETDRSIPRDPESFFRIAKHLDMDLIQVAVLALMRKGLTVDEMLESVQRMQARVRAEREALKAAESEENSDESNSVVEPYIFSISYDEELAQSAKTLNYIRNTLDQLAPNGELPQLTDVVDEVHRHAENLQSIQRQVSDLQQQLVQANELRQQQLAQANELRQHFDEKLNEIRELLRERA